MSEPGDVHRYSFPELSEEIARVDRPWRRLWFACGLLGLLAAVVGTVLLEELWRSGSGRPAADWAVPALLLACLVPSVWGFGAIRAHPPPPTEIRISSDSLTVSGPGHHQTDVRFSELRGSLVLLDFRSARPTWVEDGSRRNVDFLLVGADPHFRTPLPPDAVGPLVRAARAHGCTVEGMKDARTRNGVVHRLRIRVPARPLGRH